MVRYLKLHGLNGLLLLPLFAYLLIFTGLPLVTCIILSFSDGVANLFPSWVNYRLLFQDGQFRLALRNTLWLTVLGVSSQLLVGLGVAGRAASTGRRTGYRPHYHSHPIGRADDCRRGDVYLTSLGAQDTPTSCCIAWG